MPLTERSPLGSHSSSLISPVCLGAMPIRLGLQQGGKGEISKDDSFRRFDAFIRLGGNFMDTISNGHQEESEKRIGEWMMKRGNRKELVIATKYTAGYKCEAADRNRRNIAVEANASAESSLKNLQTTYIDVLYVDFWDWTAPIEEMMRSLDGLVKEGKILNLGISDTPAWVVSQANQYARDNGLTQFSVYQGNWSLLLRNFHQEILPMCMSERMALCPWGELEDLKSQPHVGRQKDLVEGENSAFLTVGKELGTLDVIAVALAYALLKFPSIFPIIGGAHFEHFYSKITSLSLRITQDHIRDIEGPSSNVERLPCKEGEDSLGSSSEEQAPVPWYSRFFSKSANRQLRKQFKHWFISSTG